MSEEDENRSIYTDTMRDLLGGLKSVPDIISNMFSTTQQSTEEAPAKVAEMIAKTASGVGSSISRMPAYYQRANYLMDKGAMSLADYSALGFVAGLGMTGVGVFTGNAPLAGAGLKTMAFSSGIGNFSNFLSAGTKFIDASFYSGSWSDFGDQTLKTVGEFYGGRAVYGVTKTTSIKKFWNWGYNSVKYVWP